MIYNQPVYSQRANQTVGANMGNADKGIKDSVPIKEQNTIN